MKSSRSMILIFIAMPLLSNIGLQVQALAVTPEEAKAAFVEAAKVLQHPRCLNCHPSGDRPTQGDDMHIHAQNVQRGINDHGRDGMNCKTCHSPANFDFAGVPGNPKWALAPRSMGWQGLSVREICEAMKDKKKNHNKTLAQLVEHNAHDELVAWAWDPGEGREPAPGTQEEFGKLIATWAEGGGACPD